MTQWKLTLSTERASGTKGKENQRAKESPRAKEKARANTMRKARVQERARRPKSLSEERAEIVAKLDTSGVNAGRKAVEPRNKRTVSENLRKLETSTGS